MKLLVGGDFYISDAVVGHKLINITVERLFESTDYRILNLEGPIVDTINQSKITKTGIHLRMPGSMSLSIIKQLRVDLVTLANNHIMDYGREGLCETINKLQQNGVHYVGAGENLQAAGLPFIIQKDGLKIAILNFAEQEWSIASDYSPGCNPLDVIDNVAAIREAKQISDKVICIIHGGHEHYNLPSPRMVKQYHFYAENGADAVICHHTHCIGAYEVYLDCPIIYSLGNFLFTLPSDKQGWFTGLVAILSISKDRPIAIEIFYVVQEKPTFRLRIATDNERYVIEVMQKQLNKTVLNINAVQEAWDRFVNKKSDSYLSALVPSPIGDGIMRSVFLKSGLYGLFLRKDYLSKILNLFRCESHRDIMLATIASKIEKS